MLHVIILLLCILYDLLANIYLQTSHNKIAPKLNCLELVFNIAEETIRKCDFVKTIPTKRDNLTK